MAAGETRLFLSNGITVSIYTDASPVGSPVHVNAVGAAGTSSPYYFTVSSPCVVRDIITTTTTTGILDIYANGQRTEKRIPTDQRWVAANDRLRYMPKIGFRPGVKYSFIPSLQTS